VIERISRDAVAVAVPQSGTASDLRRDTDGALKCAATDANTTAKSKAPS